MSDVVIKAFLHDMVKEGDTVYTVLRHVSRSGMLRVIDLIAIRGNEPWHCGYNAAEVLGRSYDRNREGIKISGCGMDMGFALVYDLAHVLFGNGYALKHSWL